MIKKLYYWLSFRRYALFHIYEYDVVADTVCKEVIKNYESGASIKIHRHTMDIGSISIWCENRWYAFAGRGGFGEGYSNLWEEKRPSFQTLIALIKI